MSTSDAKKFHDVMHPGKVAANASSKPVIVSNRPILKDPMVRDDGLATLDLQQKFGQKTAPHFEQSATQQKELDEPYEQSTPEDPSVGQEPTQESTTSQTIGAIAANHLQSPIDQADTHAQELHNLVENQTYFVHIGKPRKTRRIVLIALPFLLIASAALGYAIYMTLQN